MQTPVSRSVFRALRGLLVASPLGASLCGLPMPAIAAEPEAAPAALEEVVVTARRRSENAQDVPAALSVISGEFLTETNTSNIYELAKFVPSVQFQVLNPRNSQINIRGLGNAAGLANDGLDPGVGFYVDQVYYNRPATATFDMADVERVEVLRGPQGTLYGKNTTAGAVVLTTAKPSFTPDAAVELSAGGHGYVQAKANLTGPIVDDRLAGRLSAVTTSHDGLVTNTVDGRKYNDYRNWTVRGQALYTPSDAFSLRVIGDYSKQETDCCALILSDIVSPSNGKNFVAMSQRFGYNPVVDPSARKSSTDAPIYADQETGGVSAIADWTFDRAVLTSVTAWRFWNWTPAGDVDATPIDVIPQAAVPVEQDQYTQEFRIASTGANAVDYVAGLYFYREDVHADPVTRYGSAATYFLVGPLVPALALNGVTATAKSDYRTTSYAGFGQATWHATSEFNVIAGLRYTHDSKDGSFDQVASGGVPLLGPLAALAPLRAAFASTTAFDVSSDNGKLTGQLGVSYQFDPDVLGYATYSTGSRSGALNLAQLPAGADPIVKPESIDSIEAGVKSYLLDRRMTLNVALFQETDTDYQANVYDPAVNRLYLSNVPKLRSRGVEVDIQARPTDSVSLYASGTYDDAEYISYKRAPCGLEDATLPYCDLSGSQVAGVPKWAASAGGEYVHPVNFDATTADAFFGLDYSYRSSINTTGNSPYTELDALNLVNARAGVRSAGRDWAVYLWVRNLFDEDYLTWKNVGVGNTGQIVSNIGDQRTWGATLRYSW